MSKLVAIEALNFMTLKQARVEMDESGILNLTGYNDSGKSAFTRLIEVVFYDNYANEQVNFIHDGEEMSGAGLEFDDGVSVNKYKYRTGKSVWEMLKGDEVIYTNRLNTSIASMNKVPEPIAKYLNVVEDQFTGELLNVRRNTDKLFLVGMSGGDVYKIINSVLHLDVLAETVKRLNADCNKEQSLLTAKANSSQALKSELKNLRVLPEPTVTTLSDSIANLEVTKRRLDYVATTAVLGDNILNLTPHPILQPVDTSRYHAIKGVAEAKTALDRTAQTLPPEVPTLDTTRLTKLQQIMALKDSTVVSVHPDVNPLNPTRFNAIRQLGQQFNEIYQHTNALSQIDKELAEAQTRLQQLSAQHGFKICNNCGTVAV